jgi:site-specific DNA recombinase
MNAAIYCRVSTEGQEQDEASLQAQLEAAIEEVDNSEVGKLVFYIKVYTAKLDTERRRDPTGLGKKAILKTDTIP